MDTVNMIYSTVYDDKEQEKINLWYSLDGSILYKEVLEFNETGIPTGSKFYENGNNAPSTYYLYELDKRGRKIFYEGFSSKTDSVYTT